MGQSWEAGKPEECGQVAAAQTSGRRLRVILHLKGGAGRSQRSKGTRGLPTGTENDLPDQGAGKVSQHSDSLMIVPRKNVMHTIDLSFVRLNCFGDCL